MELRKVVIFLPIIILASSTFLVNKARCEGDSNEGIQEKFQEAIGGWIKLFETNLQWFSSAMLEFMRYAIKTVYFLIGLAGFIMWATGISRYTGKKLVIGALLMAIVSEILL